MLRKTLKLDLRSGFLHFKFALQTMIGQNSQKFATIRKKREEDPINFIFTS
jgi:hypothetical protein